jgi:hypothetical protein
MLRVTDGVLQKLGLAGDAHRVRDRDAAYREREKADLDATKRRVEGLALDLRKGAEVASW